MIQENLQHSVLLGHQSMLRFACFLIGLVFILSLSASTELRNRFRSFSQLHPPNIQAQLETASRAFDASDFKLAESIYSAGLHSLPGQSPYDRVSFLLGLGNCHLATHQYRKALHEYNDAFRIAGEHQFEAAMRIAAVNRASVYRRMRNPTAAMESMRQVEPLVLRSNDPQSLGQAANVVRDFDLNGAARLYRAALLTSQDKSPPLIQAMLWNQLGYAYLLHNRLDEADGALTEALRLRVLNGRRQLQSSYFYLGTLRLRQGDYRSAVRLLERAIDMAREPGAIIWSAIMRKELAAAYLGLGESAKALDSFERAIRSVAEWRLEILPADIFRVSSEEDLRDLFVQYIQTGMSIYEKTGDMALAKRMFLVSEDSRSALFRASRADDQVLPAAYVEKLTQFRRALGASLNSADASAAQRVSRYRIELADFEAELGLGNQNNSLQIPETLSAGNPLTRLQRKLRDTETLLSFHTADRGSWMWAVTNNTFEVHRIPAAGKLRSLTSGLRQEIQESSRGSGANGAQLRSELLTELSPYAASRADWILSLDGPLFDLPFAALPAANGSGVVLGEMHSLRYAPTALYAGPKQNDQGGREFVGMADPVYNGADDRLKLTGAPAMQLARLPGTKREIERCARAWGQDAEPRLLTGVAVTRNALLAQIDRRPGILHFGMHVLPHPRLKDQVMMAVGLQATGEPEYLTPAEIETWRKPLGLVSLSGCSSGSGDALPGIGLFGLTRAWLRAGARAVVASYWPIPDDSGQMLSEMYAELGSQGGRFTSLDVAQSLRVAQTKMRKEKDWRGEASYWASFFVVAKE